MTNNATLMFNRSNAHTVANAISGTGTLVKTGAGTTTLTGANAYTGATTILAGTLQVGSGGTTGTLGSGAVANDGALIFNRSDSFLVANAITGTGTVRKMGAGTLTLTGAHTYSGTTTISTGTLQLGNGGTDGSLGSGAIANAGTLAVDRSDAVTLANTMTGAGRLVQAGAGVLTLTGANSYTGTTTINAGTLQVGDGGSTGSLGTGAVTNNATLLFNRSNALTVANAISGTGAVVQTRSRDDNPDRVEFVFGNHHRVIRHSADRQRRHGRSAWNGCGDQQRRSGLQPKQLALGGE